MASKDEGRWAIVEGFAATRGPLFTSGELHLTARTAISMPGKHLVVYGQAGTGKSRFARQVCLSYGQNRNVAFLEANCHQGQEFASIWSEILEDACRDDEELVERIGRAPRTPSAVAGALAQLGDLIVAIDDVHRAAGSARAGLASVMKLLHERAPQVTLVLIGRADSVNELLDGGGIEARDRVTGIPLERWTISDAFFRVRKTADPLGIEFDDSALELIYRYAKGQPGTVIRLALDAALTGHDDDRIRIAKKDVEAAVNLLATDPPYALIAGYEQALSALLTPTPLLEDVLLACARTEVDLQMGTFARTVIPREVSELRGQDYTVNAISKHLNALSSNQVLGTPSTLEEIRDRSGGIRYRFTDPLLPSYILARDYAGRLPQPATAEDLLSD